MASIVIKLKSRTLEILSLDEDCNYVLQSCNLDESSKYSSVILSVINFITWDLATLKILSEADMIDWNIYSSFDLSFEILKEFINRIHLDKYLTGLESKYKTLPIDGIEKLKLFIGADINNQLLLKNHAIANPSFYYEGAFLSEFKFAIDIMDVGVCKRYICTENLINEFIQYLTPTVLEHFIRNISLKENTILRIIEMFEHNILERNRMWNAVFQYQRLSYSFILRGALSNSWSYDVWISILSHQKLSDNELIELFRSSSGRTIMQLSCRYKILSESFILNNWEELDIPTILKYQPLTYEFVKTHHSKIDLSILSENQILPFKIVKIVGDDIIDGPIDYIIVNNPNEKNNVIFVD